MSNKLPFSEWDSMPVEVYRLVLSEMKEQFSACISEVISVTDKTTSYVIGFLTYLFGVSAFIFVKYPLNDLTWWLFGAAAIDVLFGVAIVRGRKGFSSGLDVDNILTSDFDDPEFDKEKLAYFNMLKAYQIKVYGIRKDNEKRARNYNIFLVITVILMILIASNALATIYCYHKSA